MRKAKIFKEVECKTAEAFLDEMVPFHHGRLWNSRKTDREWAFRGVSNSNMPLTPSAFRENTLPYARGQIVQVNSSGSEQRNYEDAWAMRFCSEANHFGLTIPGDRPEFRDVRRAKYTYDPYEFPPLDKLHMFALAQHYGVPTRLLDWSRKSLVAAYFAAIGLAKHKDIIGQKCAVWALDLGYIRQVMVGGDPAVYLITAPKSTNPNLDAQDGLFTLVQPKSGDPHPIPDLDQVLLAQNRLVPKNIESHAPFLYKFTLPAREVRVVLSRLSFMGVNAGTVYPGFAGTMESILEYNKLHQHRHTLPHDRVEP